MRFSLAVPAALVLFAAGAAGATTPAGTSATPPSAAPVVYCPQVILPPACRPGGSGVHVPTAGMPGQGHGRRTRTSSGGRSSSWGRGSRVVVASRGGSRGYDSYGVNRSSRATYDSRSEGRGGRTVYRDRYVYVDRSAPRGRDDYARNDRYDYDSDRSESGVRYARPGSGPGYRDTWSGYGGRYGVHPGRMPPRATSGYGYSYSTEDSDRITESRRVEGYGHDGVSGYTYSYRSPPRTYTYERYGYAGGHGPRVPGPGADRYSDRFDHRRGHDEDMDRRGRDADGRDDGDADRDDADRGRGGHHDRYAENDRDGRGGDHHRGHDRDDGDRDGGRDGHHGGRGHDGGRGHGEGYAGGASGYQHYGAGGSSYSSSSSSYGSSSSSYGSGAVYGSGAYGHGGYVVGGAGRGCNCGHGLRGNGSYPTSTDEDGFLTWANREDGGN